MSHRGREHARGDLGEMLEECNGEVPRLWLGCARICLDEISHDLRMAPCYQYRRHGSEFVTNRIGIRDGTSGNSIKIQ